MSSTADNALHIGEEVTYGTAVVPTRTVMVSGDEWEDQTEEIEIDEINPGFSLVREESLVTVEDGGTGKLPITVRSSGMGLILKNAIGDASISGTTQTFTSNLAGPATSLTVQNVRSARDNTIKWDIFGAKCSKWMLKHSASELLQWESEYIYQGKTTAVAPGITPLTTGGVPFNWRQAVVTVGGAAVKAKSFELSVDNKIQVENYLQAQREEPCRVGMVEASGKLELDLNAASYQLYQDWTNNQTTDLAITWTNGSNTMSVTLPKIKLTNVKPKFDISNVTEAPVEFQVVSPDAGEPYTVVYDGADTAF